MKILTAGNTLEEITATFLRVGIQGGLTDSAHPAQNVSW